MAQLRLAHEWAANIGLLLIVDQFEELFAADEAGADEQATAVSRAARAAYIRNLLYAASLPSGNIRLVIALRADFYHRCSGD